MGCGMSTEEKEGKARNEEIENQLKRDRMQQRNEIKMLLLGMFRPWASSPRRTQRLRPGNGHERTHRRAERRDDDPLSHSRG